MKWSWTHAEVCSRENLPFLVTSLHAGVDDAIAILMAIKEAKRRKYEILGITASFGNVKLPQVLKNLAKVLEVLPEGRDIPVFPGCSQALVMNTTDYFPWHGYVNNTLKSPGQCCHCLSELRACL